MEEPQREESQREETVSSFWLHDGTLRPVWKLSSYFTVFIILTIPLSILSMALPVEVDWRITSPLIMLMSVVLSTTFLLVVTDRTSFFQATGLRWSRRSGRDLLMGFAVAALMMTLVLGLELLFGGARISPVHLTTAYVLELLAVSLFGFTLVSFAEEMLMRGYPFAVLHRQAGIVQALLITSVLFSIMHGFNPGITWMGFANIFLAGLWLGVARLMTGTLWLAIGLHTGWNFFLGTVYGFPVSGVFERSVFVTETTGPDILSGGSFGPEGGLLATVVLLIGTAALYLPAARAFLAPAPSSPPEEEIEEES